VIVAGVLVALAVDAAWEARAEAEREVGYLTLLHADLSATEEAVAVAVAQEERVQGNAVAMIQALAEKTSVPADSIKTWLVGMTRPSNLHPRTQVLEAVIQTGDFRLIDESLQAPMLAYLNDAEEMRQLYVGLSFTGLEAYFRAHRSLDSDPAADWPLLRGDLALRSELGLISTSSRGRLMVLRQLSGSLAELKEALERRLRV
jgi:hypothetical protein